MVSMASVSCMISFCFTGIATFFFPLPSKSVTEPIFFNLSIKHFIVLFEILPDSRISYLNFSFTFAHDFVV